MYRITLEKLLDGNFIHIKLNNKFLLQALLDSGAGISCVSYEFAKTNGLHMRPPDQKVRIVTADNAYVECCAVTDVMGVRHSGGGDKQKS